MADTVTTSSVLGITFNNSVNDENARNQTLKIPNPKTNVTETQIKDVANSMLNAEMLTDNNGYNYTSDSEIVTAYTEFSTVTVYDIES